MMRQLSLETAIFVQPISNGFPETVSSEGGGVLSGSGGAFVYGSIRLTHNRQNFSKPRNLQQFEQSVFWLENAQNRGVWKGKPSGVGRGIGKSRYPARPALYRPSRGLELMSVERQVSGVNLPFHSVKNTECRVVGNGGNRPIGDH